MRGKLPPTTPAGTSARSTFNEARALCAGNWAGGLGFGLSSQILQ